MSAPPTPDGRYGTTKAAVQGLLGRNYDSAKGYDLQPYIDSADALIDAMVQCAAKKSYTYSDLQLEIIERWLSGHYYGLMDQMFTSKSTAGASASFQGQTQMNLDSTFYGQTAQGLDPTGCLTAITQRHIARATWLGKPPSAQIPYDQRD